MDEAHARARLDEERGRLTSIGSDLAGEGLDRQTAAEDIGESVTAGQHPADQGTQTHDRSRDLGLLEQVESELRDIEDALARIDAGTYGRCEVCGGPIPDERLEANPTARYDVAHAPSGAAAPAGPSSAG